MKTEYVFAQPHMSPATDPTGALASLHYHLAATGILNLLREAWDKASDDAKRTLADRILSWAGNNLSSVNVSDLVRHLLGKVVAEGRFVLTWEQDAALVQVLYTHVMAVLQSKSSNYDVDKVRQAIVEAAKQRLGEMQAEQVAAALASQPELPGR